MKKIVLKIEVIIFLGLICLPVVGHYFGWDTGQKLVENRVLAQRPEFKLTDIPDFFTNLKLYYNDNFGFRTQLVILGRNLQINVFKNAPQSSGVSIGKNGWLFYTSDMVDNLNGDPFSDTDLSQIKINLEEMQSYFSSKGAHFYFMVAPNGQSIYPEYLPDNIKKARTDSRLDQLDSYLKETHSTVNFINPKPDLIKTKALGQLYYKTDTHWNQLGAFVGYLSLMSHIQKDFPNLKVLALNDFNISIEKSSRDDLEILMGTPGHFQDFDPVLTPKTPFSASQLTAGCKDPYTACSEVIKEVSGPSLPKLVAFRDSFSASLIPYLSESFQRSHYFWKVTPLSTQVVDDEKPDIVIYEMTERELWRLPHQKNFDFQKI